MIVENENKTKPSTASEEIPPESPGLPSLKQMSAALREHEGTSEQETKTMIYNAYKEHGFVSPQAAAALICRARGIDLKGMLLGEFDV